MKEFFSKFFKYTFAIIVSMFFTSIMIFITIFLLSYKDYMKNYVVYRNFNLIKYLFLNIDSILFFIIPFIIFISIFIASYRYMKKENISLFPYLTSVYIIVGIIFFIVFGIYFNTSKRIQRINNSLEIEYSKLEIPKLNQINYIDGIYYYFLKNRVIVFDEDSEYKIYKYKKDYQNIKIIINNDEEISMFQLYQEFNLPLMKGKLKYYLTRIYDTYLSFILKNYNPYYFIMILFILPFISLTSYIVYDYSWKIHAFFIGLVLIGLYFIGFGLFLYFILTNMNDIDIVKKHIYFIPMIYLLVADMFIFLVYGYKVQKMKFRSRIR